MDTGLRWKMLFLAYILMFTYALVFQSIPPILGLLIAVFGLSHAQAGALMSLFALPGIIISIPGGVLADLYGSKKVGTAALLLIVAGTLLVGIGQNFLLIAAGRVISGTGSITLAIIAPQILSRWFFKSELGTAAGIFNSAMPVGSVFALNLFSRFGSASGWRAPPIFKSEANLKIRRLKRTFYQ